MRRLYIKSRDAAAFVTAAPRWSLFIPGPRSLRQLGLMLLKVRCDIFDQTGNGQVLGAHLFTLAASNAF